MQESPMQLLDLQTRVTALEFLDSLLFYGEGNVLSIIDFRERRLISKTEVLKGATLHGIRFKPSCSREHIQSILFGGKRISYTELNEQRRKVKEVRSSTLGEWIWDVRWLESGEVAVALAHNAVSLWDPYTAELKITIRSSEPSLLYSAHLIGSIWETLVLAAGTVYQEIVIWAPAQGILHRLQGHQGVIFSIDWSEDHSLLVSTSDDRSVRVWKALLPFPDNSFVLLHTLFAHHSRVWKAAILKDKTFISVGEDSMVCFWSCEGKLKRKQKLLCGGIWSLAINQESTYAVVGGGDGSLHQLKIDASSREETHILPESVCPLSDFPRSLAFLDIQGQRSPLLVVTDQGFVLLWDWSKWHLLHQSDSLKNYSALSVQREKIAIATIKGSVHLFCEKVFIAELDVHQGAKVHAVFWLEDNLLTSGPNGETVLWSLEWKKEIPLSLVPLWTMVLPKSKHQWVTSAIKTCSYVLLGDRDGGIHLYKQGELLTSWPRFHGKNGVSSLAERNGLLYSVGRNGQVVVLRVTEPEITLKVIHSTKIQGLEWIGRLIKTDNDTFLLAGFHSRNFMLCDEGGGAALEFDCGGGHREWDLSVQKGRNVQFACVRRNSLHTWMPHSQLGTTSLREGFHRSKICCATIIPFDGISQLIASGGEDNDIIVSKFDVLHGHLEEKLRLRGHISIVRALVSLPVNKLKTLLLSAGGQSQFVLWEIAQTLDRLQGVCLCNHLDDDEPRVRYMDAALSQKDSNVLLFLAGSDSCVRTFMWNGQLTSLSKVILGDGACLLKLLTLQEALLTGDNSGRVCLDGMQLKQGHGRGGVNALDAIQVKGGSWLVCSGGDDNFLLVQHLESKQFSRICAHAAQITSVKFINHSSSKEEENSGYILSCSLDQRLVLWRWTLKQDEVKLCFCFARLLSVPDVSQLLYIPVPQFPSCILVFGFGVESLKLEEDHLMA